jgi:hypothetical protein
LPSKTPEEKEEYERLAKEMEAIKQNLLSKTHNYLRESKLVKQVLSQHQNKFAKM